jgi:hypothetical protein
VLGERVGLRTGVTGESVGNVHESPAARAGDLGAAGEAIEEARDEGLQVNLGVQNLGAAVAYATQGVGGGIANRNGSILHHAEKDRQSLLDQRLQNTRLRALHDTAKGSHGGIPTAPVLVANVLLDKADNGLDHIALHTLSVQLKGLVSGTRHIVLVIISILILAAHGLQEDRDDLTSSHASEAVEWTSLDTLLLSLVKEWMLEYAFPRSNLNARKELTSALSSSIAISSSQTVHQNSIASLATSSSSLFMPIMLRPKRAFSM